MLSKEKPASTQLSQHSCFAHLAQDDKAGLVRGKRQHDEVSIEAIEAVSQVGLPAGTAALLPDVGHDLVLALPRHIRI